MKRNDSKGTSTTSFPVDRQITRVDLCRRMLLWERPDFEEGVKLGGEVERTLTKLVSQALLDTRKLS